MRVSTTVLALSVGVLASLVAVSMAMPLRVHPVQNPDAQVRGVEGGNTESGTYGVDVSRAVSKSEWECISKQNAFAIIRAYRSSGSIDPAAAGTIVAARAAGIRYVDAYHFPATHVGAAQQVQDSLKNLRDQGAEIGMYWLDIERYAWSSNKTYNAEFIGDMITAAKEAGATVGIYTSMYSWPEIAGDSTVGAAYPLWYPHYESPPQPNYNDFRPFGGWSRANIKQYKGTSTLCGASVDLNWYP